ncbi:MAG: purine-nucleoside/S-methyl-5-thioadenosine phosphorylase / adenosine deaminase [Solirubrobacteraceae bacterium]|jgi:YfiH family protein|nr:purine-nucleoside/S-methyl-5-thioadenosine phosphorylase / adenosine deaminase [Solirubrobacteraceae bacterium]
MTGGIDPPLDLRLSGGARVRFTTRRDGDLGLTEPGPVDQTVSANRAALVEASGLGSIVVGRQVHGTCVGLVRVCPPGYVAGAEPADGQATDLRGVGVAVHAADCLPIALAGDGAVAMVHAGWRGLAGGVIAAGVDALRELGVDGPIEAAIGPGAGGCCYETGPEVRDAFGGREAPGEDRRLDLKEIARRQLAAAGVVRIHDVGICTLCAEPGLVFSHRRDGPSTGRQAGIVWLD